MTGIHLSGEKVKTCNIRLMAQLIMSFVKLFKEA